MNCALLRALLSALNATLFMEPLFVCEPSVVLRHELHACLCIDFPHLPRRLLLRALSTMNIKAGPLSLCVPSMSK